MSQTYTPTAAELANAQAWVAQNGGGTAGSPWTLDGNVITVPISGNPTYPLVTFGWGAGWFANFAQPANIAGGTPSSPLAALTTSTSGISPLLLIGAAVAAYFFFFKRK